MASEESKNTKQSPSVAPSLTELGPDNPAALRLIYLPEEPRGRKQAGVVLEGQMVMIYGPNGTLLWVSQELEAPVQLNGFEQREGLAFKLSDQDVASAILNRQNRVVVGARVSGNHGRSDRF